MASSCWLWWQSVSRAVMNMGHASPSSPSMLGRSSCAVTQWTWFGFGFGLGLGLGLGPGFLRLCVLTASVGRRRPWPRARAA